MYLRSVHTADDALNLSFRVSSFIILISAHAHGVMSVPTSKPMPRTLLLHQFLYIYVSYSIWLILVCIKIYNEMQSRFSPPNKLTILFALVHRAAMKLLTLPILVSCNPTAIYPCIPPPLPHHVPSTKTETETYGMDRVLRNLLLGW